jgi:hypothetical protein
MTRLWTPLAAGSIVDTPVGALIRDRHVDRLHALADSYDDREYDVASRLGLPRARYNAYWAERTRAMAQQAANEPAVRRAASAGVRRAARAVARAAGGA